MGVGVKRGGLAGPVTPACAPGRHPGSPTRDKASGGLPGPPPGSGGHEAGCPRGWGGRGPPTRKLLASAGIHGVCVGGGSAHHRRYACDTRERRVGQTRVWHTRVHGGEAHALHRQRGGGWRACLGPPVCKARVGETCARTRDVRERSVRGRACAGGPGWACAGAGELGPPAVGGRAGEESGTNRPGPGSLRGRGPGAGLGGGAPQRGSRGARGRGPGSACTHRAALRSPGRRRVHPSVRPAVGASRARGARRRRGAGRGAGRGRAERAPGPRAALPPPPPGRGLGRGRGGGRARAAAPRPAAPPGPDVAAPRVRLEPRAPWARPFADRFWRRVLALARPPRPAGPQCPRREDGRASPSMLRGPEGPGRLSPARSPSGGLPHHPGLLAPGPSPQPRLVLFPSPHSCLWPLCDLSQGP